MRLVGFLKYIVVVCCASLLMGKTVFSMDVICETETGSFLKRNQIEFKASEFSERLNSTSLIINGINWNEKLNLDEFKASAKQRRMRKGSVTYLKEGVLVAISCQTGRSDIDLGVPVVRAQLSLDATKVFLKLRNFW